MNIFEAIAADREQDVSEMLARAMCRMAEKDPDELISVSINGSTPSPLDRAWKQWLDGARDLMNKASQ